MIGLMPLYGLENKPTSNLEKEGKEMAMEDLPEDVNAEVYDVIILGDWVNQSHLSVEVEVVFPDVDSEEELPDRDELFPTAEVVSFLAVEEVEE